MMYVLDVSLIHERFVWLMKSSQTDLLYGAKLCPKGYVTLYVCLYVYFGTCLTIQNGEIVNNGSEKRRHVTKAITRS